MPTLRPTMYCLASIIALAVLAATATAQGPIHSVRGHATYLFDPPNPLEQISINAWQDELGTARGAANFPAVYLADPANIYAPQNAGWLWFIDIHTVAVSGSAGYLEGIIVFDNRFPENEGSGIGFIVFDNGNGASADPDELIIFGAGAGDLLITHGNFTVR